MSKTPNARLEDRRKECIAQAREAESLALSADPDLKEGYLSIARAWRQLAEEIARAIEERDHGRPSR
ncbi:MAG TPA: hypothetical protein VK479_03075 [Micropepsaceae bacterium]|nr:hypothetical protein [Micropepsaceae bacterium]